MDSYVLRGARAEDSERVALLHADSWRRHYRGAYADSFLDGEELAAGRRATWAARLATDGGTSTVVAEDELGLAGFVHVVLDDDGRWGSLVDNLHVRNDLRRSGIGTRLLTAAARAVLERAGSPAMYLWVLEQNRAAQAFYRSRGGRQVERVVCRPAGIEMNGTPYTLRMSWPDAAAVVAAG